MRIKCIKKIYSQNPDTDIMFNKVEMLPIGLANSMWPHGSLIDLYKTMSERYIYKKTKNIYININENTYFGRKNIIKKCR